MKGAQDEYAPIFNIFFNFSNNCYVRILQVEYEPWPQQQQHVPLESEGKGRRRMQGLMAQMRLERFVSFFFDYIKVYLQFTNK